MVDLGPGSAGYADLPADAGTPARGWWDDNAAEYLDEHGDFLGSADLVWCPEGLREADARLLGDPGSLRGATVLEVGCGAAQGARWLTAQGARAIGLDLSAGMLAAAAGYDAATGVRVPVVQADARALPLPGGCVDVAFTAFGALPFVPDPQRVHAEVARVLRPGGRWVFAVTHPVRWAFPDDPAGLTAFRSYFDRRPYLETDEAGRVAYAEHHRTLGDHVADLVGAGFVLERLVEPEWPAGLDREWGGWGPVRGELLPGTAIFCCRKD